jgi:polysaccharide biosynthesis/export protein ExoF
MIRLSPSRLLKLSVIFASALMISSPVAVESLLLSSEVQAAGKANTVSNEPASLGEAGLVQTAPIAVATPAQTSGAGGKAALLIGDRLKIMFFETLEVEERADAAAKASARSALRTFYQRMDLTGEYSVQQDGTVSLPRLGTFGAAGRTIAEVRNDLTAAFEREMARTVSIDVTLTERQPIYVIGPVKNAGVYKHVPGMMVLHALAFAGGFDRGADQMPQVIDAVREAERLQKATDRLKRLLAHHALLQAERDRVPSASAPARLIAMIGEEEAKKLINSEQSQRLISDALKREQMEALTTSVVGAREELQALRGRLNFFAEQIASRSERLKDLEGLQSRGSVTRTSLITVQTEIADIKSRQQEALVAIAQAQQKLAQAEQAQHQHELGLRQTVEQKIAQIDEEISELENTIAGAQSTTGFMQTAFGLGISASMPTYEIIRRNASGPQILKAEETSELEPGDVLRITGGRSGYPGTQLTKVLELGRAAATNQPNAPQPDALLQITQGTGNGVGIRTITVKP